jgi:hypothetical protein
VHTGCTPSSPDDWLRCFASFNAELRGSTTCTRYHNHARSGANAAILLLNDCISAASDSSARVDRCIAACRFKWHRHPQPPNSSWTRRGRSLRQSRPGNSWPHKGVLTGRKGSERRRTQLVPKGQHRSVPDRSVLVTAYFPCLAWVCPQRRHLKCPFVFASDGSARTESVCVHYRILEVINILLASQREARSARDQRTWDTSSDQQVAD